MATLRDSYLVRQPSRWEILAYALSAMPLAAVVLPLAIVIPAFYAAEMGIGLAAVGLIGFVARLWDVTTDLIIGSLMDRYPSRFGRRRHWILIGTPLLALGVVMLYFPSIWYPGLLGAAPSGWYFGFWMFFVMVGWTIVNIAHTAWGGELSADYHQRATIQTLREVASLVGLVLTLLLPAIITATGGTFAMGVGAMGLFFLILFPLAFFVSWRFSYEFLDMPNQPTSRFTLAATATAIADVVRDRVLMRLLTANFLQGAGPAVVGSMFFFVAKRIFDAGSAANAILLGYFLIGGLALPLWLGIARRYGKHRAFAGAMFYAAAVLPFIFLVPRDSVVGLAAFTLIYGVAYAAGYSMLRAMTADILDHHQLRTGVRSAGMHYALYSMSDKLGFAFALLTYPLLAWIGFDPLASGPAEAAEATRVLTIFSLLPMVCLLVSGLLMWRFRLDAKAQEAMRVTLRERDAAD